MNKARTEKVVSLLDGKVISRTHQCAADAVPRQPVEINLDEPVASYATASLRIAASMECLLFATRSPAGSEERRFQLQMASRLLPTVQLLALAERRNELGAISPIATALNARVVEISSALGAIDATADDDETAKRLMLSLGSFLNELQPYVLRERERDAGDPSINRVTWDEQRAGYLLLVDARNLLRARAEKFDIPLPPLKRLAARLDRSGNPVRHMQESLSGGGRGNRRVFANDVITHADYLLGRADADPYVDQLEMDKRISAASTSKREKSEKSLKRSPKRSNHS